VPLSDFSLVESSRSITGATQTERTFLDFAIDLTPTYPNVLANGIDNITPLWLGRDREACLTAIGRLLGDAEPDAPLGRVSVYVCAECADLGCGSVTVVIERGEGTVTWRDWGYQNNYEEGFVPLNDLPDVTFDAVQYDSTLREAAGRLT
jgi:hypothetical protein